MSDGTRINYVDATWSPVTGCSKVSAGCHHCFSEQMARRLARMGQREWERHIPDTWETIDRPFSEVRTHPDRLNIPLHWRKQRRILVPSMGDIFHAHVQLSFINQIYTIMTHCPRHDFFVLTKRADRMASYLAMHWTSIQYAPGHIVHGVSVENTLYARMRIGAIWDTPYRKWISAEPLLEDVTIPSEMLQRFDWVVIGCESGPSRRPCHLDWVYKLADACQGAGVPVWIKQIADSGRVEKNVDRFPPDLQQFRQRPRLVM